MRPEPYAGVGTIVCHIFRDDTTKALRKMDFANILFDQIGVERGVLVLENTNGDLVHVPNVAYYTVEPLNGYTGEPL